ncbi:MAG: RNA-binding S4 domain-containing protein [Amaricoccus sp.]|uniref:RNA-binding S4 domain-containing protein n=1 Tax=Amaricoccus sp. TaxID=1872485 RepID=UPI0039E51BEE
MADPAREGAIRLDKWLWHARFCKSRAIAQRLIESGAVRVNAVRVAKPATSVRPGDGITLALAGRVRVVRILALGVRRGPAPEAQALYSDVDALQQAAPLEPGREPDT